MQAYSQDLRDRILADLDAGLKTRAVAVKFSVSESWVRRLKQRRAATGETTPRPSRNRRVPFHQRHESAIRAAVAERPSRTLVELRRHLGVGVHLSTLWHALQKLGLSWKKSRSAPPSKRGPTSPRPAATGGSSRRPSTRSASSSSTKPRPRPA
jgi:transposase